MRMTLLLTLVLTAGMLACGGGGGRAPNTPPPPPSVQAPTNLTYSTNPATYPVNSAITANIPHNQGGAITAYAVSPALPAGLGLDLSTGIISGTPLALG